jgi:hypothetical protein
LGKNFDSIYKHGAFKLPLAPTYVIPNEANDLTRDHSPRGLP